MIKKSGSVFLFSALLLTLASGGVFSAEVSSVSATSIITGRASVKSEMMIVRKGSGYFADHDRFTREQIQELLAALLAPPVERLDPELLGVTQPWLDSNAERILMKLKRPRPCSESENLPKTRTAEDERRFLESFKNLKKATAVVENHYRKNGKGGRPLIRIAVNLDDGSEIKFRSVSPHLWMLPWRVEREGRVVTTYNPRVSRALGALLPFTFSVNRARLTGDLAELTGRLLWAPEENHFEMFRMKRTKCRVLSPQTTKN